ncbi:MAG TPA: hypothetical protein VF100_00640 [Thermoanaerobaculia bacterium]
MQISWERGRTPGAVRRALSIPPARRQPRFVALLPCAALVAALGVPMPVRAEVRPVGAELPVAAPADLSSVAVRGDGGFVVVWRTREGEREGSVWLQRFAPDDRPLGPPRFVGADRAGRIFRASTPVVGLAADGSMVVAWIGPGTHVPSTIQVRLFDAEGLPRGAAFRVSGGLESMEPRLAVAADGSFVVGWTAFTRGTNPDAYGRRFTADGTPLGERFLFQEDRFNDQILGGIALAPDGRLAATVDSLEGEALLYEVFLSIFAADGTPVVVDRRVNSDPEVDSAPQNESTVVHLADGRWLVVFFGPARRGDDFAFRSIHGRLFDAAGEPLGPERALPEVLISSQQKPVAAPLADGGFVVLWRDACDPAISSFGECDRPENHRDGSFAGVFGRAFEADGDPAGGDFRVNVETFGDQMHAALAAGPAGDLVATWSELVAGVDSTGSSLAARRLAAPCDPGPHALCLGGGRFRAEVEWHDFFGNRGAGVAEARDDLWGTFWFFDPENLELALKLIDGRAVNGHWWVFFGALSNVAYTLRVTDTATGRVATYRNPTGTFASRGDTAAFEEVTDPRGALAVATAARSAAIPPPPRAAGAAETTPCQSAADRLCLLDGRFAVEIDWRDRTGNAGRGFRLPLTGDTGAFWFFRDDNPEVLVKVLDARTVNGHFWVFFGSLTDVAFRLAVTDTATGERRVYENPQGHLASRGDTAAFPPPAAAPGFPPARAAPAGDSCAVGWPARVPH